MVTIIGHVCLADKAGCCVSLKVRCLALISKAASDVVDGPSQLREAAFQVSLAIAVVENRSTVVFPLDSNTGGK